MKPRTSDRGALKDQPANRRAPRAYYPLFADLAGRRCVVVGGGIIAQRKVTTLLSYGAEIVVISPELTPRLRQAAGRGRIRHVARRFRPGDVASAWLVYAATDDQRINEAVFRAAQQRRIFANIVDQPALCSFIAPAISRRGSLVVAISTGGASPTVAKHFRREVDAVPASRYARMIRLLQSLREPAKQRLPTYNARRRYFDQMMTGRVFSLVQSGQAAAAKREALAQLDRAAGGRRASVAGGDAAARRRGSSA